MQRRDFLKGAVVTGAALILPHAAFAWTKPTFHDTVALLATLERAHGGRLGVATLDTGSGRRVSHRGDERFLMCSTFKLLLVAAVLKRVDAGKEQLDRRVVFDKSALLDYAPITKQHVGPPGMTVTQLCEAAITLSDNTAANLLIASVGGPSGVTDYARELGDPFTLLDRIEPALNPYDTTKPSAMLGDMQKILLGNVLSRSSRTRLTQWMLDCQTGLQSLRAGLPGDWRVGDKTGSWDGDGKGVNNDVAILWPPHRQPLLVTAYYDNAHVSVTARKAVLADVGRMVATM